MMICALFLEKIMHVKKKQTLANVLEELQREDAENDVEENNTNTEDNIRDGEEESIQSMFSQGQRVSHYQSERSSTKKKRKKCWIRKFYRSN